MITWYVNKIKNPRYRTIEEEFNIEEYTEEELACLVSNGHEIVSVQFLSEDLCFITSKKNSLTHKE